MLGLFLRLLVEEGGIGRYLVDKVEIEIWNEGIRSQQ
jgi:hypothetical protein